RLQEAEISYRETLRLKPGNATVQNNLGEVLVSLGHLQEAEVCFRDALRLAPAYAQAYANLGGVLLLLADGRPQEAEACCREALRIEPGSTETLFKLRKALYDQEKTLGEPQYFHELYNDKWIIENVFPGLRRGYFVEAGALGGKWGTATYVLE